MLLAAIFHAPHPKIIVHSSAAPPFQTELAPLGFDQLIAGVSPDTARPAVGAHLHRHVFERGHALAAVHPAGILARLSGH